MHISFLTHYFPPEVNAPASRTFEHCKRWIESGHDVCVITCNPNHPTGKVYPGYANKPFQKETKNGIKILRVWTYLAANKGFFKRILNYLSYMIMSTIGASKTSKCDVVISTSPQFFCGLAGYFFSKLKNVPWVLEIRDLWPESILAVGAINNSFLIKILKIIELFVYKKSDCIVVVTDAFKEYIVNLGIPAHKISVIKNGVDLSLFKALPQDTNLNLNVRLSDKFIVSYIGTHGMAHGLETILKAAKLLENNKNIFFLLVGDGAERNRLLSVKSKLNLTNVELIGQIPKDKIPAVWSLSDACIVHLKKNDAFRKVIPSKIFEAMAMDCPIILGVEGESSEIVKEAYCGLCVEPENEHELSSAILQLTDNDLRKVLSANGSKYVKMFFNRDILAKNYLEVLRKVSMTARQR